jgi:drug/metabolite transporter (DMT)-like permease
VTAAPLHLPRQDALKGGVYMAIAMAGFVSNDTLIKLLSRELPVGTLIFWRGVFASLILLAALSLSGALPRLKLAGSGKVLLRSLTDCIATILFITALAHMPIANLTSISHAAPLVVTALAAIFLKEHVGWRRTTAIAVGFLGVLLITRPSSGGFDRYALMGLGVVAGVAIRDILTRRISTSVPALVVALANSTFVVAGAFALAAFEGGLELPSLQQLLYLMAAGVFLSLGYLFMVQTLRYADISASATIRFTGVLWALLSGVLVFGEIPDRLAFAGIALIVLSGIYTLHREAKLKRLRTTSGLSVDPEGIKRQSNRPEEDRAPQEGAR